MAQAQATDLLGDSSAAAAPAHGGPKAARQRPAPTPPSENIDVATARLATAFDMLEDRIYQLQNRPVEPSPAKAAFTRLEEKCARLEADCAELFEQRESLRQQTENQNERLAAAEAGLSQYREAFATVSSRVESAIARLEQLLAEPAE